MCSVCRSNEDSNVTVAMGSQVKSSGRGLGSPGGGLSRLAAALALCALAACSTTAEDLIPESSASGAYPTSNALPPAATEQLTDEEAQAGLAALNARRSKVAAQGAAAAPDTGEQLRRIAATHRDRALDEIEGN